MDLTQAIKNSSFTLKDKIEFYKKEVVERTYSYNGVCWNMHYRCVCGRTCFEEFFIGIYSDIDVNIGTWMEKQYNDGLCGKECI